MRFEARFPRRQVEVDGRVVGVSPFHGRLADDGRVLSHDEGVLRLWSPREGVRVWTGNVGTGKGWGRGGLG
jgi:hypothetical protein